MRNKRAVDTRDDFRLETFRRVAADGEGVVSGPAALAVMCQRPRRTL